MKTIQTVLKVNIKGSISILLLLMIGTISCSKDDAPPPVAKETPKEEVKLSGEKQITSFVFLLTNNPIDQNVVATIDEENKTITAAMPPGTDISGLLPEVKISELATVDHDTAQDFTEPLEYKVTAEDGSTAVYTVTITALLTQRQILQAILDTNPGNTLAWELNATENLGDLDGVTLNTEDEIIELHISSRTISILPKEVGQLTNLEYLSLISNELSEVPAEIGKLTNLTILQLGDNQLTSLPAEIGQLTNLTILNLGINELSELPTEIGQLTNLTRLGLTINKLTSIPPEIWQLTNLTSLRLDHNGLTSLPPEIRQLTHLTNLDLDNNQLTSLPAEIGQLTNLEYLEVINNQLTSIPAEIGELTNLKFLFFDRNQINILPPEIGRLTNLFTLGLFDNQLSSLIPEIGFLINLDALYIASNNITKLPTSICNLTVFHNVEVQSDITLACETTSQKDALISIYSANPGNTLGWGVDNYPEVSFHDNGNPKVITMNNKNLTRIPESISSLSSLETFNVNNNNLESLPAALGSINSLGAITAASNQLSTVPSELGQLQNLALLSITNNPITSIPEEVCNQQISNGGILTILTDPGEGCN
jgi:leucine-rich repeat protein SHOC2